MGVTDRSGRPPAAGQARMGAGPGQAREGGVMSRQVVLNEDEVRAFASLLSRISQRLDNYEQQTHEDRQYAL